MYISERAMAPNFSTLAWKIPWMGEPGGLQSMGSLRVGYDWATSLSLSLSCIGEGNGNPLQCSCLENPRDGGAWWAAIYGVAQSRTQLNRPSSSSSVYMPIPISQFLPPCFPSWCLYVGSLHLSISVLQIRSSTPFCRFHIWATREAHINAYICINIQCLFLDFLTYSMEDGWSRGRSGLKSTAGWGSWVLAEHRTSPGWGRSSSRLRVACRTPGARLESQRI